MPCKWRSPIGRWRCVRWLCLISPKADRSPNTFTCATQPGQDGSPNRLLLHQLRATRECSPFARHRVRSGSDGFYGGGGGRTDRYRRRACRSISTMRTSMHCSSDGPATSPLGTAPPVVTPVSLTRLAETLSPANQGGRFSALASQTGDYGSIDVFRSGTRRLVMAADPWGSTHAGRAWRGRACRRLGPHRADPDTCLPVRYL